MATISLSLPVSGTVITAGLHSANYTAIQGAINGGLDTANWASGKIFAPSKIMQESAVDGDGLAWDNGATIWKRTTDKALRIAALSGVPSGALALPVVYARATSSVDVVSTTTETSIFSQSISANDMSTNRMLRLELFGDYLYNNNAADTLIVRCKFGGTTIYQSNAATGPGGTGANRQPWKLLVSLANMGATNSQALYMIMQAPNPAQAAPTTGIGNLAPTSQWALWAGISTLATIDTTANQTLDITVQWSASSANDSWRRRYGVLELV